MLLGTLALAIGASSMAPMWAPAGIADDADAHIAFRGTFSSDGQPTVLRLAGASQLLVWLDGNLIEDGPARFAKPFPEYQDLPIQPSPGRHVLAIHAHNDGVTTRILSEGKPFLNCGVFEGTKDIPIEWHCARIPGYRPRTRRISDILGWIDWVDTTHIWPGWQGATFEDAAWPRPVVIDPGIGPIQPAKTRPVQLLPVALRPIASGPLADEFGYEADDPSVRFFLRDLTPRDQPAQGEWRRYDLGRVRLGRPRFTIDVPRGAVVEFALCEQLRHGRVHPWITLSGSPTCNFDHFVACGGQQEFMPTTPKGGRFLEVHILSVRKPRFVSQEFLERTYYGEPQGSFKCDDPLLTRIWQVGVDTVRACSDDSLVDCPTRERGEWTGDVATVATDICSVAFDDLSLSRRGLVQAAQAARRDGLVAGVGPGDPGYLSTYAAQWVCACVHYWELTGDKSLLEELWPAAKANLASFRSHLNSDGVQDSLGWAFVDWGYVRNSGPTDIALDIHTLLALNAMERWQAAVAPDERTDLQAVHEQLEATVRGWLSTQLAKPGGWQNVGYQRAALALLAHLVEANQVKPCIAYIKNHLLRCFPNDPSAPRLSDPGAVNDRFMTPYFCHFALTALMEHGETDFVLNQYRKCWGWALSFGDSTWLEVFDTRWSHCHEWSGCPTWQLSRYVLGLRSRFDLGPDTFELDIHPGSLKHAEGILPTPSGHPVSVHWTKTPRGVEVRLNSYQPIHLHIGNRSLKFQGVFRVTV